MGNSLAIAAVTMTLRHLLHEALAAAPDDVGGADVTTYQPVQLASAGGRAAGINVFLYQVTPNSAWTTTAMPSTRADGSAEQRPRAALDLRYLITCYGDDRALEPQRLLARAVVALAGNPVLTRDTVAAAMAAYSTGATQFLEQSDLADQSDAVKLAPTSLSVDETAQLWSMLGVPYLLSLTYTATAVLL